MLALPSTDIEQGTAAWYGLRAGSVTGSRFADVLSKLRSGKGEAASRRNYRLQLIAERLTGFAYENFTAKEVEWGKMNEPLARLAYEMEHGTLVEQLAFVPHPKIEWCGVSPDGVIYDAGQKGIVEIKCPYNPGVHLSTYLRGSDALAAALLGEELPEDRSPIPPEHIPQVQGNMWVCEAEFCEFISYDPRYPEHMRLYVYRVRRDDAYIKNLEIEVLKFLDEVEENVSKLLLTPLAEADEKATNSPQPVEA